MIPPMLRQCENLADAAQFRKATFAAPQKLRVISYLLVHFGLPDGALTNIWQLWRKDRSTPDKMSGGKTVWGGGLLGAVRAPGKGKLMKQHFLALSFGVGAMLIATQHAFAQTAECAPHDIVVQRLAETYGETRQSIGLAANNALLEVFAAADTGTWTITATTADGVTCLVASGQAFESMAGLLPPPGKGA